LASGVLERVQQPMQLAIGMKDWVANLSQSAKRTAATAVGLASAGKKLPTKLAKTPLTTRSTEWRRYQGVTHALSDYKQVKNTLGGTVNDVALAVVAGALRAWLLNRGEPVAPEETIRVMAPVSLRRPDAMDAGGNVVSAMIVDLPVGVADPLQRYQAIVEQTKVIKRRGEAVAAGALMPAADFIAPNLFAIAVRSAVRIDVMHTVVTNVPGPQRPLYVNGATVTALHPFLTTFPNRTLTHGVLSVNGQMCWGIVGERDAMYDLAVYADFMDAALTELLELGSGGH
jgi:WS/DGAT/MGAT family acyltransferase